MTTNREVESPSGLNEHFQGQEDHTVQGEYWIALKMLILVYCEEKLTSGLGMTLRY
jgi:hypothetical protein